MKVTYANACYTGGGIYAYFGRLDSGNWFMADDDGSFLVVDSDPEADWENAWYLEWQCEHSVNDGEAEWLPMDDSLWNAMLQWILVNKPDGNYDETELRQRMVD